MNRSEPRTHSFVSELFSMEPAGTFSHGHVLVNPPDIISGQNDPEFGYWKCDLAHHDTLTWSERVYGLFGLPNGAPIDRDWAVARYNEPFQSALKRVRTYAIDRKLGFILDAEISPVGTDKRWIRVLAAPITAGGRLVALHGLKRAL